MELLIEATKDEESAAFDLKDHMESQDPDLLVIIEIDGEWVY